MHIIATHQNTDFDALAAMVAASLIYPGAIPVVPRSVNPNVKAFLSIHKDLFDFLPSHSLNTEAVTQLTVVDTNRWERLDGLKSLKPRGDLDITVWDHHTIEGNIAANTIHQEAIGATVSMLVRELEKQRKILTPIQATLFLAGIYEDTGNLSFTSTTADDAYAAGFLLSRKADLDIIASLLRPAYGQKQKEMLFRMLESAERFSIRGYKIGLSHQVIEGHVDNLAIVVRMYMDIINVDAAFGIFEHRERDRSIVIGRSRQEGVNIGEMMKLIGGGGHARAGSAMVRSIAPGKIQKMIKELIRNGQQASVQISDIMSFPVISVPSDTSMAQVAQLLREKGCTGVPVVDNQHLVGMISRRDFKKVKKEVHLERPVKAYMSTQVRTISPGKSPMHAARVMVKHDIGRLPVVEDDRIIGIITRSDAMLYFYDLLPD